MEYLMVDKKQAADSYGLLKWKSTNGFLPEEKRENYKSEKENGRGGKAYI